MTDPSKTPDQVNNSRLLWAIRLLSLAAAALATYLFVLSISGRGLPVGCGSGSGCAEVLQSTWSAVFGIPVSGPALLAYAAVIFSTFLVKTNASPFVQEMGWRILLALGTAIAASVVWFVIIQTVVIKSFCIWCMTDHAIGLLVVSCIFYGAAKRNYGEAPDAKVSTKGPLWPSVLIGVGFAGMLFACQLAVPYKGGGVVRLPEGQNADSGPGADRQISILSGKLVVLPHEEPIVGSPDASHLLTVLFDYSCPHCRRTHQYLEQARERYGDVVAFIPMPMPLNSQCNPHVEETEPRFKDSCELARLALAVWNSDPTKFVEYDRWLFESEMPRELQDAKDKAEQLVGAEKLAAALSDPTIDQKIARNVQAYEDSTAESIPVVLSPDFAAIVGRPEDAEELFMILESDVKLVPVNGDPPLLDQSETEPGGETEPVENPQDDNSSTN